MCKLQKIKPPERIPNDIICYSNSILKFLNYLSDWRKSNAPKYELQFSIED